MRKSIIIATIALLAASASHAQRLPGYLQAEKFTAPKLRTMLFSTSVTPHWYPSGNKFWYEYKTSDGNNWYVVDPVRAQRTELFDRDALAATLTQTIGDPVDGRHLSLNDLKVSDDGHTFTFNVTSTLDDDSAKDKDKDKAKSRSGKPKSSKKKFYFSYDPSTRVVTHLKDKEADPDRVRWANISPDKKTVVFAKDFNLYRMSYEDYLKARKDEKDSTIVEIQLTTDGVDHFGYGLDYSRLNTDTIADGKRKGVYGLWSPDSRHFLASLQDERDQQELWVINSLAQPRPTLESYRYQMPGETPSPVDHLYLFDMTDNSRHEIPVGKWKDQTIGVERKPRRASDRDREEVASVWAGSNNKFYLTRSSRDLHRIDLCTYTIGDDSITPLIRERLNTYQETRPINLTPDGSEIIQWSERNGWAHLYLYDDKGNLKNAITQGPWHVEDVVRVDPATRTVYFTANGRDANENPYYEHLYRVGFDGTGLRRLSRPGSFHNISMSDDARYAVDNISRVDTIPVTVLLDANGRKIMDLEHSDFSQLLAAGYKFPEVFKVKAADGVTDLWGTMFKPFDFDSTKVYPIIDYVYPGPQVEATNYPFTRMSVRTDRLAQAGFIVITVGQRGGHPSRSKWYHNFGYGNMRDYPLADHKYAVEQLAAQHPYIDIDRVGMHGHSGGGFMTAAAMFSYPDFYKAGVSCAGNHDNNIYNRWWSETHHGVREKVSAEGDTTFVYSIATNPQIAKNLKGHLMLVHGDIDNNVHPANTLRVVDALIRANKRFDMLILPGQRHGFGDMDEYFYWRMVDFFSNHLLGAQETTVDIPKR